MILKKMIGNTLKDLGFVTQTQLDEALKKQKQIFKSKIEGIYRVEAKIIF